MLREGVGGWGGQTRQDKGEQRVSLRRPETQLELSVKADNDVSRLQLQRALQPLIKTRRNAANLANLRQLRHGGHPDWRHGGEADLH